VLLINLIHVHWVWSPGVLVVRLVIIVPAVTPLVIWRRVDDVVSLGMLGVAVAQRRSVRSEWRLAGHWLWPGVGSVGSRFALKEIRAAFLIAGTSAIMIIWEGETTFASLTGPL